MSNLDNFNFEEFGEALDWAGGLSEKDYEAICEWPIRTVGKAFGLLVWKIGMRQKIDLEPEECQEVLRIATEIYPEKVTKINRQLKQAITSSYHF